MSSSDPHDEATQIDAWQHAEQASQPADPPPPQQPADPPPPQPDPQEQVPSWQGYAADGTDYTAPYGYPPPAHYGQQPAADGYAPQAPDGHPATNGYAPPPGLNGYAPPPAPEAQPQDGYQPPPPAPAGYVAAQYVPPPEVPAAAGMVPPRSDAQPPPTDAAPPIQQPAEPHTTGWSQTEYREPATHTPPAAMPPQQWQPAAPAPKPEDLLLPDRPEFADEPAQWGWRGRLNRMSGYAINAKPRSAEVADRKAQRNIQRGFSRPMTIVVIQPKGGAGKTPTTIGLASALGAHRGGYVVGWDDNETRGTLAVRVGNRDSQRTTVWDLLSELSTFERADARVGDLSYYVRSQGEAQFDALVSDDLPANMEQIGEDEFRRIHAVLQRFYRLIVIDTGNNVRSPNWQAAVNAADVVVVPCTYQRDAGYSGSWVLDHLIQTGREDLARTAVTVLTAADPSTDRKVRDELIQHFSTRTHDVVEIPYDLHIATGGPIHWDQLAEATRRAWVHAGATVVQALSQRDQPRR